MQLRDITPASRATRAAGHARAPSSARSNRRAARPRRDADGRRDRRDRRQPGHERRSGERDPRQGSRGPVGARHLPARRTRGPGRDEKALDEDQRLQTSGPGLAAERQTRPLFFCSRQYADGSRIVPVEQEVKLAFDERRGGASGGVHCRRPPRRVRRLLDDRLFDTEDQTLRERAGAARPPRRRSRVHHVQGPGPTGPGEEPRGDRNPRRQRGRRGGDPRALGFRHWFRSEKYREEYADRARRASRSTTRRSACSSRSKRRQRRSTRRPRGSAAGARLPARLLSPLYAAWCGTHGSSIRRHDVRGRPRSRLTLCAHASRAGPHGGLGTRLDPLTRLVAKPAVPLAGRTLIERVIGWLSARRDRRRPQPAPSA